MKNKYHILAILITIIGLIFIGILSQNKEKTPPEDSSIITGVYMGEEINEDALYLFFSPTCPHCRRELAFLESIESKYPNLVMYHYDVALRGNQALMKELAAIHDVEELLGGVPLTFVGEHHFIGYEKDETTGVEIENAILDTIGTSSGTAVITEVKEKEDKGKSFELPFIGTIYAEDFSLPILAILLGFLDGFNVCSLGALVLIIGLTLKLQRRKAILLLGGTFIVTTALVYGGLIVFWAKLFEIFGSQVDFVKILVALLALGGGVYFLKEYLRMRRQGAQCELSESKLVNSLMERTGRAFEDNTKILGLLGSVLVFAAVITIVEFPCSAATPLVFAGVLSSAGISATMQGAYIALFVLFYMLDEIIIFGIAAYKLKLWMTNGTFTKYAVLGEAIILIVIGLVFIAPLLGGFLIW